MSQLEIDNEIILDLREDIAALNEEITNLREQNAVLRNKQRIARSVLRGLREKLEIARKNDENFQIACEVGTEEVGSVEGGLPKPETVELLG